MGPVCNYSMCQVRNTMCGQRSKRAHLRQQDPAQSTNEGIEKFRTFRTTLRLNTSNGLCFFLSGSLVHEQVLRQGSKAKTI